MLEQVTVAVTLSIRIGQVLSSDLDWNTYYPDIYILWIF
jgi:hypothetical protein